MFDPNARIEINPTEKVYSPNKYRIIDIVLDNKKLLSLQLDIHKILSKGKEYNRERCCRILISKYSYEDLLMKSKTSLLMLTKTQQVELSYLTKELTKLATGVKK